jgi:hypothetical protein
MSKVSTNAPMHQRTPLLIGYFVGVSMMVLLWAGARLETTSPGSPATTAMARIWLRAFQAGASPIDDLTQKARLQPNQPQSATCFDMSHFS